LRTVKNLIRNIIVGMDSTRTRSYLHHTYIYHCQITWYYAIMLALSNPIIHRKLIGV